MLKVCWHGIIVYFQLFETSDLTYYIEIADYCINRSVVQQEYRDTRGVWTTIPLRHLYLERQHKVWGEPSTITHIMDVKLMFSLHTLQASGEPGQPIIFKLHSVQRTNQQISCKPQLCSEMEARSMQL